MFARSFASKHQVPIMFAISFAWKHQLLIDQVSTCLSLRLLGLSCPSPTRRLHIPPTWHQNQDIFYHEEYPASRCNVDLKQEYMPLDEEYDHTLWGISMYLRKIPGTFSMASSISSGVMILGRYIAEKLLLWNHIILEAFEVKDHSVDLAHAEVVLQMVLYLLLPSFGLALGLRCHFCGNLRPFINSSYSASFACLLSLVLWPTVVVAWLTASVSSVNAGVGGETRKQGEKHSNGEGRVEIVCTNRASH